MSWEEKVKNKLKITTGDGQVFDVIWVNPSKAIEWNGAELAFLEIKGTLAKRKKLLGRKFPLEFYFQGPDHLDDVQFFENSADDPRPWVIEHPYYGIITARVFALNIDNSVLNISKITGTAIETINEENPISNVNPIDDIAIKKLNLDNTAEAELTTLPSLIDGSVLTNTSTQNYKAGLKVISLPEEAQLYTNAFSEAMSAVNVITASPMLAMRATIALITLPAKFTIDVQSRVNLLVAQFKNLRLTLVNIFLVPSKQIYETQGVSLLSSMCLAASTPLTGNYKNASSATQIVDTILANYELLLSDLDNLQDPNGGNPDYFIPGFNALNQLNELVNTTVSALLQIALNGRTERSYILTEDSNVILLTHRFYGLDPDDNNVTELIDNNGFTYHDMLGIKKGRRIVYYI